MNFLKTRFLPLCAAAALLLALSACGSGGAASSGGETTGGERMESGGETAGTSGTDEDADGGDAVSKEDCASVYAEIISVNGDRLTVSAGEQVLELTVEDELLTKWTQADQVILYYTGDFGSEMQVHYIDKWTENSDVQRPESGETNENSESSVLE